MADLLDNLLYTLTQDQAQRDQEAADGLKNHPGRITFGPDENNLTGPYATGNGVWSLSLIDKMSPDIAHAFLTRMGMMYLKVRRPNQTPYVTRDVKEVLINEKFLILGQE